MNAHSTNEKYNGAAPFWAARLRRAALRTILRPLVKWAPLDQPEQGYTVLIGCLASMLPVLRANLALLQKQDRQNLREIIAVIDAPRKDMGQEAEALRAQFADLPLRIIFYSPMQARVLRTINWAWCYSWLSWSLGIAACRTRYALLQDLDALLLRPDLLEQRYQAIRQRGNEYLGVRFYRGNGIRPDDELAVTFELMFNAAYVRREFKPVDLFNYTGWCRGRRVEFDTFLHAQHRKGKASALPVRPDEMVHPSQLFCQWMELRRQANYVPPSHNNLPLLPYFFHVGGDPDALAVHREALEQARQGGRTTLLGRPLDLSTLGAEHARWLIAQIERVERAVAGEVRPEVRHYVESLWAVVTAHGGREAAAVLEPAVVGKGL